MEEQTGSEKYNEVNSTLVETGAFDQQDDAAKHRLGFLNTPSSFGYEHLRLYYLTGRRK
jgi:hypothetical protein